MRTTAIQDASLALACTLASLPDWTDRYHYIIEQGRRLPAPPPGLCTGAHRVHACASVLWLRATGDARCIRYQGASDCPMDAGLMALAFRVYGGRAAEDIVATPPAFIAGTGLDSRLSMRRLEGLYGLVDRMRDDALQRLLIERIAVFQPQPGISAESADETSGQWPRRAAGHGATG